MSISSPQRIIALDAENIKKLKAVHIDAAGKNVMVIGGRNAQGKSSLLDDDAMAILADIAAERDVQIWIERVGNDKHTSVVIEDGCIAEETEA